MDFDYSPRQKELIRRVSDFMDEHIYPAVPIYEEQANAGERWKVIPIVEELKVKARKTGLWNMFMPPSAGHPPLEDSFQFEGVQLTNLEYAPICEMFGRVGFASEVFNCSAPDTGNMEVLNRFGTLEQKERWLRPLMNGEIRSAFLMTEPRVASSDATNIEIRAARSRSSWARPIPTPPPISSSRRSWCRSMLRA
jgi:acyl-CoA dehydrogenase